MATESFYEDIVIDDAEKSARMEELFREHPVAKIVPIFVPASLNDPEVIRSFVEAFRDRKKAEDATERLRSSIMRGAERILSASNDASLFRTSSRRDTARPGRR